MPALEKFRLFFLPHRGNGFVPHSIRPKHLLLHASIAGAIKLGVMAVLFFSPLSALLAPDVLADEARQIVQLTNQIRQGLGIPELAVSPSLGDAAADKASNMAALGYFSHTGPDGKRAADWLKASGYDFSVAGENLAVGFATSDAVVGGWKDSRTHYANMIDPDFSQVGVGVSAGRYQGKDVLFVAQYLAHPATGVPLAPAAKADVIDPEKSTLTATQAPEGVRLQATAYLSDTATKATAYLGKIEIPLRKTPDEPHAWNGEVSVPAPEKKTPAPLVLAVVAATDAQGNTDVADIGLRDLKPVEPTPAQQYAYLKQNPSHGLQSLLDATSGYYAALIAFMAAVLSLAIFVEIRKQHPHLILSTTGLILFLLILIHV